MAFKGTAAKSSTGASMSKYDVEVEARLKELESKVAALESHSHGAGGSSSEVEALSVRVQGIIDRLGGKFNMGDL